MTQSRTAETQKSRASLYAIIGAAAYGAIRFAANQAGPIWPFGAGSESMWLAVESLILVAIAASMLAGVSRGSFSPSDWGLRLDRASSVVAALLAALVILSLLYGKSGFGFEDLRTSISAALRISSTEIIIRALFVSSMLSRFGHSKQKVLAIIMLSGLMMALVRLPEGDIMAKELGIAVMVQTTLGYFYYASGSVVITMFFPVFPGESVVADHHNPLFAMLLYIALGLAAMYVSFKKEPIEPALSRNG